MRAVAGASAALLDGSRCDLAIEVDEIDLAVAGEWRDERQSGGRACRRDKIEGLLELVDLGDFSEAVPKALYRGMAQRVEGWPGGGDVMAGAPRIVPTAFVFYHHAARR